jgi:tetratricopeptide (TPR) repeat protein/transglutaminase-like putative cysteine protease
VLPALPLVALAAAALAAGPDGPVSVAPGGPVLRDPIAEDFAVASRELERDRSLPRGLVALAKLERLHDEVADLPRLAAVYARAADDPKALSQIRSLARYQLARVERSRGNLQKAAADLRQLGFLGTWQVIGPFDDEGKVGFDASYAPEKAIDLGASYPGKAREVAWRPLPPEAVALGFVNLGAVMRPARQVAAYALAVVESPCEQRVRLWAGASGPIKIWLNGALAIAERSYHPARPDQFGAAVTLRKGPNRILVKLCHEEGRLGFFARLADAAGNAAPLRALAAAPLPPPARSGDRPERLEDLLKALERRAHSARGKDQAPARLDLAIALEERCSTDSRERRAQEEARRAAALAPRWVEAQLVASRLEDDSNRRRVYLEAALSAAPADPVALTARAVLELQRGRPVEATALYRRAVEAAPAYVLARAGLAAALEQAGLGARAERERQGLARQFPFSPAATVAAARGARGLDRADQAALLMRKGLALRYDDEGTRGGLAQLLVEKGDVEGALELLDASVRLDPSDLFLRLRKADLLASNGRLEEAERAYADVVRICPDEPEGWERRGQARLRAGRQKDALADFQRALELKPQNPRLKELVRLLEPELERFEMPYLYDARELAKAQAPRDEDVVVLGDLKVTRVFPSGLAATYVQLVVKVLTPRGADAWRNHSIGYAPDRQELRVERGRVTKPDGTVVETWQESERSQSEPWYRLYYDTRVRTLSFPSLSPGDVVEIAYRTEDVASENMLSDYFGDVTHLEDSAPKARFDYVLLMPQGRAIHASDPGVPGLAHTERPLPGGVVEHRWSARDLPKIQGEPGMPGWSEVSPFVHVSTYTDWGQVAAFYWGLVRDQLRPTQEIRDAADRIARGVQGRSQPSNGSRELEVIRAVYDFVVSGTRYVGLEFGIHGYKPYRVDQILERRFGDCKDKASLMHALLESLGIDSRLVLLRMKRLGRVPDRPASLAVFNHAILYVPKYDLWLDGTAAYSGSRDLPGDDRGAAVLVINPGEPPRFGYIPEARPEDNRTESTFQIVLSPGGAAGVRGESRIAGAYAPGYRRAYATENDRRATFEQAFSQAFPGLQVKQVSLSDLSRIEDDVTMRFTLDVARYAQKDGDGLRFPAFGNPRGFGETYAPLSSRRYDLVLGDPWQSRFTYRYVLPSGWSATELPQAASDEASFGAFEVRYRAEASAIVAEGRVSFKLGRIAAADYPAFREFVTRIDRAMARTIRVSPPATAGREVRQ